MEVIEDIYLLYWGAGILIVGGLVFVMLSQYRRNRKNKKR